MKEGRLKSDAKNSLSCTSLRHTNFDLNQSLPVSSVYTYGAVLVVAYDCSATLAANDSSVSRTLQLQCYSQQTITVLDTANNYCASLT